MNKIKTFYIHKLIVNATNNLRQSLSKELSKLLDELDISLLDLNADLTPLPPYPPTLRGKGGNRAFLRFGKRFGEGSFFLHFT